jgi:hypothetical protein
MRLSPPQTPPSNPPFTDHADSAAPDSYNALNERMCDGTPKSEVDASSAPTLKPSL